MERPILDIDSCPLQWHTTLKSWHFWDQISHKTIYSIKFNNKYNIFSEKYFCKTVWINIKSPYFLTDNCFYDLYHRYSATFIEHGWVIFLVLRIIGIPSLSSWCCDWWCVLSYLNKMTLTHIGVKYISFWVNTRLYNMLCFKLVILMYSILSKHCLICSNHIIDF